MARVLFVAILAMCLVAMMECSPVAPDQAGTPSSDPMAKVEELAKTISKAVEDGIQEVANNPTLLKLKEDAQKLFADGAQAIHDQLVPKTQ